MADAHMGAHPWRAAPDVEVVPVLLRNSGRVDVGIHDVIGWISGQGHHAPKVCHKHAVGSCPQNAAAGFLSSLGVPQICLDILDKLGDSLGLINLATSVVDHESDVNMLNGHHLVI